MNCPMNYMLYCYVRTCVNMQMISYSSCIISLHLIFSTFTYVCIRTNVCTICMYIHLCNHVSGISMLVTFYKYMCVLGHIITVVLCSVCVSV